MPDRAKNGAESGDGHLIQTAEKGDSSSFSVGGYIRALGSRPVVLYVAVIAVLSVLPIMDYLGWLPREAQAAPEAAPMAEPQKPDPAPPQDTPMLTDEQSTLLDSLGWKGRVGDALGVWVSIHDQKFYLIEGRRILWETPCSTAAKGAGSKMHSFKTPLGWHRVAEKVGDGRPWGQIFREKKPAKEVWKRGDPVKEDLVLTRVLVLSGEEPGRNQGGDVDSYARAIYIHGTNDEEHIGTPTSHGCVRLTNDDVLRAFERIPAGTLVLITE